MKCPNCKYISFDYNERCPSCGKDLTKTRKMFDLIAFKRNPPYLLDSLTGESSDTGLPDDAASWSVKMDDDPEELDMQLDKEDLSEALPEEVFTLDLPDLDDEILSPEGSALEMLGSGDASLEDTVKDLPAAQGLSSEIATAEIGPEIWPQSENQGK